MLRLKLVALTGTVLAAAALSMAGPLAASADGTADVDAVVYAGATGQLNPPVQLVGGSGTFTFTALCAGVSADSDSDGTDAEVGVDTGNCISASGTYANTVCGTGSAAGSGSINTAGGTFVGVAPDADTYSSTFGITFVAGIGLIQGTATEDGGVTSGPLVGTAQLIPTGGNCVQGVSTFTVAGVLVTTA